jgi:hypothetical protein
MRERSDLSCATVRDWMEERADGRLDPTREGALRTHLDACADCREALEDVTVVRGHLSAATQPRCPDSVVARILDRIDHETGEATVSSPSKTREGLLTTLRRFLGGPVWRPVAVAGAAALFLAVVLETERHLPTLEPASGLDAPMADTLDDEQLKQAVAETRLAFAIFARTLNDTGQRVGQEVRTRLATPMMHGIQESFDRIPPPIQSPEPEDGAVLPGTGVPLRT